MYNLNRHVHLTDKAGASPDTVVESPENGRKFYNSPMEAITCQQLNVSSELHTHLYINAPNAHICLRHRCCNL